MKYRDKKNKRGFTLIELIAVLVILAIIALIVTPLVMNIIKKAKDSANKRSVDAYGKAVELAVATHLLDYGDYPTDLNNLTVEYSGNEVVCNVKTLNEDGSIYLSECNVKGTEVKDTSTEDGWYHYGHMISNEITYQAYNIGDVVTYNGMEFYIIEASDETSDRVTMLKAEPLTVDEVNTYGGVGTDNNHVNMHVYSTSSYYQMAYNYNGYGGMQYYANSTCNATGYDYLRDGCTTDYAESEVKYVVDAWANDKFSSDVLAEDETGYSARLLTYEDLTNNLGFVLEDESLGNDNIPSWMHNSSYNYWTMSSKLDTNFSMWYVTSGGRVSRLGHVYIDYYVVRPVITLSKNAIK